MIPLTVLTPKGIAIDAEVDSFIVPAEKGPLMIEKGYTPTIVSCLPSGVLKIWMGGKKKFYALFQGVLHVKENRAVLLCQNIEEGSTIDRARARCKADYYRDIIEKKDPNTDVEYARISLAKQMARLQAKNLSDGSLDA